MYRAPKLTLSQAPPPQPSINPRPPNPKGRPRRTVVGDDLLPAVHAGRPVAEQHEVPAAALRAAHEVEKEGAALQAGGALRGQHTLAPGPGPGPGPTPGAPARPGRTRSGYSVPTQPPHIPLLPPRRSRETSAVGGVACGVSPASMGVA